MSYIDPKLDSGSIGDGPRAPKAHLEAVSTPKPSSRTPMNSRQEHVNAPRCSRRSPIGAGLAYGGNLHGQGVGRSIIRGMGTNSGSSKEQANAAPLL